MSQNIVSKRFQIMTENDIQQTYWQKNCYDKHITECFVMELHEMSITNKLYMHYTSNSNVFTEDVCFVTDGSGKYIITQMYTSTKV